MNNKVYFLHISDTHVGESEDFLYHGVNTFDRCKKLIEYIDTLEFRPDFILHTGDIVDSASDKSFQLAKEAFQKLTIPIYYVNGNHDEAFYIYEYLKMGQKRDIDLSKDKLLYKFELKDNLFLTIDARGPDEIDPEGLIPEEHFEIIENEITGSKLPVTVFIHFPPINIDTQWMDHKMLIRNGDKLHKIFVNSKEKIKGVFFGHIHNNITMFKDEILYSGVASGMRKFSLLPNQEINVSNIDVNLETDLVCIDENQVIIKQVIFDGK
ncbi:MAG: metallophosphoesterase [Ignavibacteria bacterium]|jgi:3',5'-cyclic AMP phosphodiesterase CpdA